MTELDAAVRAGPSWEMVELLEGGIAHVVKVIQTRADDSSGMVGDFAGDLLDLPARRAIPASPIRSISPGG